MTGRRLATISLVCAALAFPAFLIGGEIGRHIGYDASAETAFIAAGSAGLLSLGFGIAAATRGGRGLAILAAIAGVVVIIVTLWVVNQAISES
jgi:hypothetical protein